MPSFTATGSGRVVGAFTHWQRSRVVVARSMALAAVTIIVSPVAEAHFKINMPMSWMSQDMAGGPQKNGPCAAMPNTALGDSPGTATKMVTVFQAGQTIPISVTATVAHPGWWRVALVEGASSTQTLTTLPDPMAQAGTNCTPAIMANPVWSATQPIVADGLPAGSVATTQQKGTQTLQVKLPDNAHCTNASPCTLQVIMVMTDHPKNDCYYHHCADIMVGASTDGGAPPASDAAAPFDGGRDATGAGGSNAIGTGGTQGTGGGPGTGTGTGGLSGTGGLVGASGGSTGSGGTLVASGGAGPSSVSSGGAPGSGSGGSGTTGSGTTNQSGSGSGSGCRVASGGKSSSAGVGAAGLVALALMLRRRSRS
jgi:MYXO-CTERM domain-containing protein